MQNTNNYIAKAFVTMSIGPEVILIDGETYIGEWEYGFPVSYQKKGVLNSPYTNGIIPHYASAVYAIEYLPGSLCHFTGKYDSDKTPIFTGDIVNCQIDGLLPNWYEREIVFYCGSFSVWIEDSHFEPITWFLQAKVVANKFGQRFCLNDR